MKQNKMQNFDFLTERQHLAGQRTGALEYLAQDRYLIGTFADAQVGRAQPGDELAQ